MKKLKNLIVTALVVALALGTLSAAAFAEGSSVFKITARVKGKGGTVAVNGGTPGKTATTYCADNCSVNLTAIPDDGYEFDKWVDAKGETVSTYVSFSVYSVHASASYTAYFKVYDGKVVVYGGGGGSFVEPEKEIEVPIIIPIDDETDDAPVEEPAPEEEVKPEEEGQNTEGEEEQNTVEEDTVKVDRISVKDDIGTGVGEEEPPKKSQESDNRVKVDTENDPIDPTEASID